MSIGVIYDPADAVAVIYDTNTGMPLGGVLRSVPQGARDACYSVEDYANHLADWLGSARRGASYGHHSYETLVLLHDEHLAGRERCQSCGGTKPRGHRECEECAE